jgi:hypothetical protein
MELDLRLAQLTLRNTHKPHRLAKDLAGDLWEFISYPYILGNQIAIKIRVPGDPASMITADALALDPEDQDCLCSQAGKDFYLTADYYRQRHARLEACPAIIYAEERR